MGSARLVVRQYAWQRALQHVPASSLGALLFSKFLHYVDHGLMAISKDRWSVPSLVTGLPCVMLTSTGARSGLAKTVPVVGVPDGDDIVLIASNWGQSHHPAWYYNLKKDPAATLKFNGATRRYTAREVTEQREYDRLWDKAVRIYFGYGKYKARVGARHIPILVLTLQA